MADSCALPFVATLQKKKKKKDADGEDVSRASDPTRFRPMRAS